MFQQDRVWGCRGTLDCGGEAGGNQPAPVSSSLPSQQPSLTQVGHLGHVLPWQVLQLRDPGLVLLSLGEMRLGARVTCSQGGGTQPSVRCSHR